VGTLIDGESGADVERIDDALSEIRQAVARQLGVERPAAVEVDPATLTRFSPDLPAELPAADRSALEDKAAQLDPWLQGPFLLGGDLVVGGTWQNDRRWELMGEQVPEVSGKSVLDVGTNGGYDAFTFKLRGAARVVAIEPSEFISQAHFLESVYRSGVDFQRLGWQDLDPERQGRFDLVHCHGVLYHELHPMRMLIRLRRMLADGGFAMIGSMQLASPELSEHARFVPGAYYGDPTWWWVPGRLALRWMVEAVGFEVVDTIDLGYGPAGEFRVVNGYVVARPSDAPVPDE
jgi:SAM-dependent methyltransferase